MEKLENKENVDKTTMKSRIKKYADKILKIKPSKEKAKKTVAWASIVLTILSASAELSPSSKEELAELFKKDAKKQELAIKETKKPDLKDKIFTENQTFKDTAESKIIAQETKEENTNAKSDVLEEETTTENIAKDEKAEQKHFPEMFQANNDIVLGKEEFQHLFRHAEEVGIETSQERIETELNLLKSVSDVLNENYGLKTGEHGEFKMAERAKSQIEEANETFERILNSDKDNPEKMRAEIFNKGKISWENIIKIIPLMKLSQTISLVRHELGHQEEAEKQGLRTEGISIDLMSSSGYCSIYGQDSADWQDSADSPATIWGGGIKASKNLSDLIIKNLRESNANNQLAALIVLAGNSDGFLYALNTTLGRHQSPGNDILGYIKTSKEKDLTPEKILLGMSADFILNSDNLSLIKMGIGSKTAKLPDNFWKFYYKLEKEAPEMGIKAGFKF